MYNWMKWLRLLGGWHFIAATAINPPKAGCQFAADDILLYEFCYYNPMDLLHHLEKDKEESSPLQYHIKSLQYHIKTLQEEFDKKWSIPWIWRIIYGNQLPYMKKTRKKKQVCGAACFMAAEIKLSKDVRLCVTPFSLCSHHSIIMKFSGVITNGQSEVHAMVQVRSERSRSQRSKPKLTVSGP